MMKKTYRDEVTKFVNWCQEYNLVLNIGKTKEMIIYFRKKKNDITPLTVHDKDIDIVTEYKYSH